MTNIPPEIEEVTAETISCAGSQDSESDDGHPRVWLRIPLDSGLINCPYCEKTFKLKK